MNRIYISGGDRLSRNDQTRLDASRIVGRVDSIRVELCARLCAMSPRHEQNCRLDTLPMVAIRHLITAHRIVSALLIGHTSSKHVHILSSSTGHQYWDISCSQYCANTVIKLQISTEWRYHAKVPPVPHRNSLQYCAITVYYTIKTSVSLTHSMCVNQCSHFLHGFSCVVSQHTKTCVV